MNKQKQNDEYFKNYLEYIDNFALPDIIKNDAANFSIALIDILKNINKNNQSSDERLVDVVTSVHKVTVKSMISMYKELLMDYNQWLLSNYKIEPLSPEEFRDD